MRKRTFLNATLSLFAYSLLCLNVQAQTPEQVRQITRDYDQHRLTQLSEQFQDKFEQERQEAIRFAEANDKPITYTNDEGALFSVRKLLPDGSLLYYKTFNKDAARSTRTNHLNTGGSTGLDLEGSNMIAHVWDGGHPLVSHQEYHGPGGSNRVTIMDSPTDLHPHSAHVAGTIMASGVNPEAKGMAPHAKVHAYQWDNDLAEATAAAQSGMIVSNHSYGYDILGLMFNNWVFGAYIDESRAWDELLYNAPHYLMVVAAGNDGELTGLNFNPLMSGYDMLSGHSTSKNTLVVASADDANVDSEGNLISVGLPEFSSPGPTDDLRIKPDISGNGVEVFSTIDSGPTAYGNMTGTSMASPNVAGTLLLLQEHYNNVNGNFMLAATLKGLVMHTADDIGPSGPDAKWGYGLLNAKRAAETISQNGVEAIIQEHTLTNNEVITFEVASDNINALQVSISWTDVPGPANTGSANNASPVLINDLDVRITQNQTTYYPWRLTAANANSNSGDNKVDPYERIDIENASGTYTITISHKGSLVGNSQNFSLVVTGIGETETNDYVYQNGSWSPEHPNLSATPENNIIVIDGIADGADAIHSTLDINNITVYADATLEIESILNLHGNLEINGDLIFKSGEDYDGELGYVGPESQFSGEATVHRYMSHNRAYRLVGSPVTTSSSIRTNWQEGVNNPDTGTNYNPNPGYGTHITGSDPSKGFDVTQTENNSLFMPNMLTQAFDVVDNTNETTLSVGDAYLLFVRGDRSIDLNDPNNQDAGETILRTKGELYHGPYYKNFTVNNAGDFIAFANPYQATVDVDNVLQSVENANSNHYYVYDPTLGTHGAYVTVDLLSGGNNTSGSEANQYLQPGQGAQYATLAAGTSFLQIREEHKAPGEHTHTHRGTATAYDNMLTVQLYTQENLNNGAKAHDSFGIVFDDTFSNAITSEDATMPYNLYENIGIDNAGTLLSLERRQMPQEAEAFQIYTQGYSTESYIFKLIIEGLDGVTLFLEDRFTGQYTELDTGENQYAFTIDASQPSSLAEDRFIIQTQRPLGIGSNDKDGITLYPNPTNSDTFYIHAPALNGKQVVVKITDISGRQIYSVQQTFASTEITIETQSKMASGVYLVTLENEGQIQTYRLIKE